MENPFLKRLEKEAKGRRHGRKVEKKLTRLLDNSSNRSVKATIGSGAFREKGDLVGKDFLMESKSTLSNSMSVQKRWLDKIATEALAQNKSPALAISFVNGAGEPEDNGVWVAVPLWVFTEKF